MSAPVVQWITQSGVFNSVGSENYPSVALMKNAVTANERLYIAYSTNNAVGSGSVFFSGNASFNGTSVAVMKMNPDDGAVIWVRQLTTFNSLNGTGINATIAVDDAGNSYVTYITDSA